jgi:L,D-transpeptidase catalytic domain
MQHSNAPSGPSASLSRRHMLLGGLALAALPAAARASGVTIDRVNPTLLARARAAMATHAGLIRNPERLALVDFSKPSRDTRLTILHLPSGQGMDLLVAHGRGSDPDHSGYLGWFSNEPGSLASSRGAYLTAARYVGVHGDAQRLVGLDPDNSNAIVIHGADYVSFRMIETWGKVGRSEGCFALRQDDISMVLSLLGEGTMLYADRV